MTVLKNSKGFTLIETLVSINLSFIAISLIFSFYLFAQKFSESFSRNYIHKYTQISFFNNLERVLNNSDEFVINYFDEKIFITTSNEDSIFISQDSISLNNFFFISKIENLNLSISTDTNQETLTWNDGVLVDPESLLNEDIILESNSVKSLLFEFERNSKNYSYQIFSSNTSISHLKNICKE